VSPKLIGYASCQADDAKATGGIRGLIPRSLAAQCSTGTGRKHVQWSLYSVDYPLKVPSASRASAASTQLMSTYTSQPEVQALSVFEYATAHHDMRYSLK
jgi:hypothetical protein